MDRSEVIKLISKNEVQNDDYTWMEQETVTEVFCDVRSITQTEWFNAGRNGIDHPAFTFVINRYEYHGEQIVEFKGQRFGVYRTYVAKNENLELYCEAKGGQLNGDEWSPPQEAENEQQSEQI